MSDEETRPQGESPFPASSPFTPDFYGNIIHVTVGADDVAIFFIRQSQDLNGSTIMAPVARVTVTHDAFIRMVDYWNVVGTFLKEAYGDERPNLGSIGERFPDKLAEANEHMLAAGNALATG